MSITLKVSHASTSDIGSSAVFSDPAGRLPFNMELISQWGQGVVGGTLIIIGALGFWEAREMAAGRGRDS